MTEENYQPDEVPSWDDYFIAMAKMVSTRSKDPSTKVGAVVVGPDRKVRSTGYNGFPAGVYDRGRAIVGQMRDGDPTGLEVQDFAERWKRPEKYNWVVHAECNAIYAAAAAGTPLQDCTMYINWGGTPCQQHCCPAIIQSGIVEVVMGPEPFPGKGKGDFYDVASENARAMLREAGVQLRQL
jgi:dCMP deaminase